MLFNGTHYKVTDENIEPTGTIEIYQAANLEDAFFHVLYTHKLHDGFARRLNLSNIVICRKHGQIIVTERKEDDQNDEE